MDPWTKSGRGPRWTVGTELTGAWPPAAPGLEVTGYGCGEAAEGSGNRLAASPSTGGRRGGGTTERGGGGGRSSSAKGSDRGGEEKRWGKIAVESCEAGGAFYRVGEAGRWPAGSEDGGSVELQWGGGYGFESAPRGGERRGRGGGGAAAPFRGEEGAREAGRRGGARRGGGDATGEVAGAVEKKGLTCGVHMSAREERDGGTDGRRVSSKKTYFREYAKDARAERLWAGLWAGEEMGRWARWLGPAGRPRPGGEEAGRLGRI
jgi:hypothetical protein